MKRRNQLIVHLAPDDKFIPDFVKLVRKNFQKDKHEFILFGDRKSYHSVPEEDATYYVKSLPSILFLEKHLIVADKLILHSLFVENLIKLLYCQPWLLKKAYWIIWGGDLYDTYQSQPSWRRFRKEFFRKRVIKRMGHLVSYIPGDIELCRQWYGAKGFYIKSLAYPSNTFEDRKIVPKTDDKIILLVGNSAHISNNHKEILRRLKQIGTDDAQIICPLSYGDASYAKEVEKLGLSLFSNRFQALKDFIPKEDYLHILSSVSIAFFSHSRQQAMGTTISLLGLGKKVYMRTDVAQYQLLVGLGIRVFDINEIDLTPLDETTKIQNINRVRQYFSTSALVEQLDKIWRNNHAIP